MLHLIAESLRDGNDCVEPLNAVMILGIALELVQIIARLITRPLWESDNIPLLVTLIQTFFLLIPAAYISKCWDRVFAQVLALHALAPTPGMS